MRLKCQPESFAFRWAGLAVTLNCIPHLVPELDMVVEHRVGGARVVAEAALRRPLSRVVHHVKPAIGFSLKRKRRLENLTVTVCYRGMGRFCWNRAVLKCENYSTWGSSRFWVSSHRRSSRRRPPRGTWGAPAGSSAACRLSRICGICRKSKERSSIPFTHFTFIKDALRHTCNFLNTSILYMPHSKQCTRGTQIQTFQQILYISTRTNKYSSYGHRLIVIP